MLVWIYMPDISLIWADHKPIFFRISFKFAKSILPMPTDIKENQTEGFVLFVLFQTALKGAVARDFLEILYFINH